MKRRAIFGPATNPSVGRGRLRIKRPIDRHEDWLETILPADADAGTTQEEINRRPLLVMGVVAVACMTILVLRLFNLQLVNGERNFSLAEGNRIRQRVSRAPRGVIYDRNKQVLVRNAASFDVVAIPALLPAETGSRQKVYDKLAALTGVGAADIKAKAEEKGLAGTQPQLIIASLERDKALLLDQSSNDMPGFVLDVNPIREYKDDSLLSAILGYTGRVTADELKDDASYQPTDYIGKLGIEQQYESLLRGVNGSQQTEVDSMGRPIKILANQPSRAGSNLVLSIDRGLQANLSQNIQEEMTRVGVKQGAGIAINPKNGEILAAVSLPTYDNNLFAKGISENDYRKLINDSAQPLFNKAIGGTYPTGSIIKPLIASAALEARTITPQTSTTDSGQIEVPNQYDPSIKYTFRSYEAGGFGIINLYQAIAKSSNVYFFSVGGGFGNITGLGVARLSAAYQKFGLGAKTGVDIPGEAAGRVPTPEWKQKTFREAWTLGDTFNISVGQGDLLATPLQMANAIAAIANGGTLYQPHFLKQVLDSNGSVVEEVRPKVLRERIFSESTLNAVRTGMRLVVTEGTGCCLIEKEVPVKVAAKTGTAETDPSGNQKPHAWFEAYAPYEDPQIVIVVLLPKAGEGGQLAAPVVRRTLVWYFTQGAGKDLVR